MARKDQDSLCLRRIDPTRNMRRFYVLSIQPTLFDGVSLVRHWGRIGTFGKSMVETFDDLEDVADALNRIERAKRRRGYLDPK